MGYRLIDDFRLDDFRIDIRRTAAASLAQPGLIFLEESRVNPKLTFAFGPVKAARSWRAPRRNQAAAAADRQEAEHLENK
jgi:hypothetical protein